MVDSQCVPKCIQITSCIAPFFGGEVYQVEGLAEGFFIVYVSVDGSHVLVLEDTLA
jgi:hypothetical protein